MFTRYAIYLTAEGALAKAGAAWLGWDIATGRAVPHPAWDGLDLPKITARPRKYGLHGTIKPPFVLRAPHRPSDLEAAALALCRSLAPVRLAGLQVSRLGGFLALTPIAAAADLAALAAHVVQELDSFRADPSEAELARRRQTTLTPAQEQNLQAWGYPYVLDQFRFHITLTGPLKDAEADIPLVSKYFAPVLQGPVHVRSLTLAGERSDGMFEQIARLPLSG